MDEKSTQLIEVEPEAIDRRRLEPAADALREGRLVAFPTETVYGLGANALDASAVGAIFEAKRRPPGHPLIVHVTSIDQARDLAANWPDAAEALAEAFWPGPLTLIVPKSSRVDDIVTGGLDTVGLRMPDHPVAAALLDMAGVPVAAPSANIHEHVSPTRAEHVMAGLGGRVDIVVDGGPTAVGIESTVVSVVDETPTVLRPGMIGRQALEAVVGRVDWGDDVTVDQSAARPSPGMASRHYAPDAHLSVVEGAEVAEALERGGGAVGAIVLEGSDRTLRRPDDERIIELPATPEAYAHGLYDALHRLDERGCEAIVVEAPPRGEKWRAVWDRLTRASAE